MNTLPLRQAASQRGDSAGGDGIGAVANSPAHPSYTVGEIGFGPTWSDDEPSLRAMYDAACASIVRLECELDELRAANAIAEQERNILVREIERLREAWADDRCRESCRDKAAADGGWANI